jgi:hypothetical protein
MQFGHWLLLEQLQNKVEGCQIDSKKQSIEEK